LQETQRTVREKCLAKKKTVFFKVGLPGGGKAAIGEKGKTP